MKKYSLLLVVFFCTAINAQDLANKIPDNAPFAMCFNGKNLNNKVPVKTIQKYPWMQELIEKYLKFVPKDFDQTGIDLTNKQYQYYTNRDSVLNYVVLIPLNNAALFEKMVQAKYGDSLKIKNQSSYRNVTTSKNHHLAWNDKFAVLIHASYSKPKKSIYPETEPYSDLTSIDTAAVFVDSVAVVDEVAKKEEIKPTPDPDKKVISKKGKTTKGKKTQKVKEAPAYTGPTEEEINAAQEKAKAELEDTNRKLLELELRKNDSIERLKIDPIVDSIFKDAFDSKTETTASNSVIFKNNNPKSDFFIFADLDALTSQLYSSFMGSNSPLMGIYKKGFLKSNLHMNGYFEKDKIKLNQVITPKDEETKKSYQEICDSKIDKNLLNYAGNTILGYYSIAMDTQAIMNYEYQILKNTLNSVYQSYAKEASGNEADVLIDAVALVLDEKAIADLIPGNALFVLHDLKKVKRDYIRIDYDENYQQIQTKGIQDEMQPDFTFLMNTRNETFASKLLQLPLNKSKFTATDYQLTNGYYTIHFEKDNLLENLYIGLKNGVLMVTTSKANVENLIQQITMPLRADFKKSISKNNSAAWFNIQKIIESSKTEIEKDAKSNYYDILLKNAGEITVESKFKNGAIISDLFYTFKGDHNNSLEYFFNIISEFYTEDKKGTTVSE